MREGRRGLNWVARIPRLEERANEGMELEAVFSFLQDAERQGLVADTYRSLGAEDRLRQLAVDERHRGKDGEAGLDRGVEATVELLGEELVERLGAIGVRVRSVRGHAREADDGGPASGQRQQTGRQLGAGSFEH